MYRYRAIKESFGIFHGKNKKRIKRQKKREVDMGGYMANDK